MLLTKSRTHRLRREMLMSWRVDTVVLREFFQALSAVPIRERKNSLQIVLNAVFLEKLRSYLYRVPPS